MKAAPLLLLSLSLAFLQACTSSDSGPALEHYGDREKMTRSGDVSAKANLMDFADRENWYALGAAENLKGEILVLNGSPYIATVQGDSLAMSQSLDHRATLLIGASVPEWQSFELPESVIDFKGLEQFVRQQAQSQGLSPSKGFPFLIEGQAQQVEWHVTDWKAGDREHSKQKHIESGLSGALSNEPVVVLGFFSSDHDIIFTRHESDMHLHVKTADDRLTAHLDGIVPGPGMTLRLPKRAN